MHPQKLLDLCTHALEAVLKFEQPVDMVLSKVLQDARRRYQPGSRERHALTETIYVVLRKKLLFEAFARAAPDNSGSRLRRLALLGFPSATTVLAQLLDEAQRQWLNSCRAVDPYAQDAGLLDLHRHNLPDWLASLLRQEVGEDFWPLVRSLDTQAPLDLRVNLLKTDRDRAVTQLAAHQVVARSTPYSPWGLRVDGKPALHKLPLFEGGEVEVQDEGSQLLALLVDAHRGEMVADFCAGSGGKTLALGASMRNTGRLYAFDTSAHRLDAIKPRLARSGLSNVYPVAIAHERDDRVKRLMGKMDRVLVDAPCSGLGTLRRHPDLKWRQSEASIAGFAKQQAAILEQAGRLLKPGGRLVYATCSLLRSENEEVADAFTQGHTYFKPLDVPTLLEGLGVDRALELCSGPYLRLWPHRHQTDGFFAATWIRSE